MNLFELSFLMLNYQLPGSHPTSMMERFRILERKRTIGIL